MGKSRTSVRLKQALEGKQKRNKNKARKWKARPRQQPNDDYNAYINSPDWAFFRKKILSERGRKCERCASTTEPMHIHHLHYRNFKNEKPEDVQVLCEACHVGIHHPHWQKNRAKYFMKWFANSLRKG